MRFKAPVDRSVEVFLDSQITYYFQMYSTTTISSTGISVKRQS
jgi:hypothetical protein